MSLNVVTWSEVFFCPVHPDFSKSVVFLEGSQASPLRSYGERSVWMKLGVERWWISYIDRGELNETRASNPDLPNVRLANNRLSRGTADWPHIRLSQILKIKVSALHVTQFVSHRDNTDWVGLSTLVNSRCLLWDVYTVGGGNINKNVGRGSSVGMETRYGLDGPGIESMWGRDFPHPSSPTLWPTQPPVQRVPGTAAGAWPWPPITI